MFQGEKAEIFISVSEEGEENAIYWKSAFFPEPRGGLGQSCSSPKTVEAEKNSSAGISRPQLHSTE